MVRGMFGRTLLLLESTSTGVTGVVVRGRLPETIHGVPKLLRPYKSGKSLGTTEV